MATRDPATPRESYAHLLIEPLIRQRAREWLANDVPAFDVGGFVVGEQPGEAWLLGKSPGLLAGVPFFNAVFAELGCAVEWLGAEGETVDPASAPRGRQLMAKVTGPTCKILQGERTALNVVTRASGIATQAARVAALARERGWHGQVVGTRKTTPGFRLVEKYALLVGGAGTHRYDLSQMVMLKDNHIWSCGSIAGAVRKARSAAGFAVKIEVECSGLADAVEAAGAGADVVMLDNMAPADLKHDAAALKRQFPHVLVEASGGITFDTIADYMSPEVDVISQGALTQGYPALDFSLKIQQKARSRL